MNGLTEFAADRQRDENKYPCVKPPPHHQHATCASENPASTGKRRVSREQNNSSLPFNLWYYSTMTTAIDTTAFNRGTDPILQFFTVDQARGIVEYRGDAGLQRRIEQLAERANEGELTAEEQAEYEGYVRANKFVAILQAKARKLLSMNSDFQLELRATLLEP
ncbi:MAG: hypothetical protein DWI22_09735 [Planctomycetota bacterium]|nr:MAG: hypothetical protein DWI22_09735 [Planctomycetota bacterium]